MTIHLTPEQSEALAEYTKRVTTAVIVANKWNQTCLECVHFHEESEVCRKWGERPPARTIVESCGEGFERDDIPF